MITPTSQAGRLLAHLQAGNSITRLQSFIALGIVELSSRVIDIEREGYKLNRERIKVSNRFGEVVHVTQYSLDSNGQ